MDSVPEVAAFASYEQEDAAPGGDIPVAQCLQQSSPPDNRRFLDLVVDAIVGLFQCRQKCATAC